MYTSIGLTQKKENVEEKKISSQSWKKKRKIISPTLHTDMHEPNSKHDMETNPTKPGAAVSPLQLSPSVILN